MNTVAESLIGGKVLLVVPQTEEQRVVGERIEALGAGLVLTKDEVSPDTVAASVRRLLAEPYYRARARALGDGLEGAGGPALAAELVEGLAFEAGS
jgi:UDP:flavonoid glycosyltransferase YjiC (YdhE family)